ncbi:MAG: glycosyltransferase family 4 protein [Prevotella sp.]|nr:glycosyltransferase family 4 protein [Prevotella sp.]
MIIGYDAKRIVRNGTGLGSYGRTLVNDISRHEDIDLHLYAPDEGRDDLRAQILPGANWHFARSKPGLSCVPSVASGIAEFSGQTSLWRTWGIVSDLKRDGIQLYHGLSGELPVGIRKSGIKSVVTIHDLIFLRHPEYYHWLDTKIYAWKFRQAIREADHIIAISECTKRDIMELGHVDDSRISVIYQSCAPRFTSHGDRSAVRSISADLKALLSPCEMKRYILSVGSIEERKNILLAVKALHYLPEDLGLVIAGRHTKYTDVVRQYTEQNGLAHRVQILHGVTDDELPALYAGAEAFVYPSRYEGFGIPIIEAISCGLPVVACTGSCLEEAGGPDSLYVSPNDEQAMAAAVQQLLRGADGREERISLSQSYIQRFAGRDVAGQVIDLYRRFL